MKPIRLLEERPEYKLVASERLGFKLEPAEASGFLSDLRRREIRIILECLVVPGPDSIIIEEEELSVIPIEWNKKK